MTTTGRWHLPFLDAGQAQKEWTHNEALLVIDAAMTPSVVAVGVDAEPAAPAIGDQWIVGDAPTGAWRGAAGAIAAWTEGGWRFLPPFEGMAAWSRADGCAARYTGGRWRIGEVAARRVTVGGVPVLGARQPAIAAPAGGAVVDEGARTTVDAILAALRAHGLIAP